MAITYLDSAPSTITYLDSSPKPTMFSSEEEGRTATRKAEDFQNQAQFEASPVGFWATQGLAGVNRALNTATGNAPETVANMFGTTTRPITESDAAKAIREGFGFFAPTGLPSRAVKAA